MSDALNFVLATTTVQWAGCLLLAGILYSFWRSYRRQYLLHISGSWFAMSFVFLGGGAALWLTEIGYMPYHPFRFTASAVSMIATYLQVVLILVGSYEIVLRRTVPRRMLLIMATACTAVGLLLPLAFVADPSASAERYFIRFGLRSLMIGVPFIIAGFATFRTRRVRGLGARMVGVGFTLYGINLLHYFVLSLRRLQTGDFPAYSAYLTSIDFFLLVVIGLGTVVWMLDAERDRLARATRRIDYMSNYDRLTGLANRRHFLTRLDLLVEEAQLNGEKIAIGAVDLDGFKSVNDSFGRAIGDAILRSTVDRMLGGIDGLATLARTGGDEFAFVLRDVRNREALCARLETFVTRMREPFFHLEHELFITASVGAVMVSQQQKSAADLLLHAEAALHAMQRSGRDGYTLYSRNLGDLTADRLKFESSLHKALEGNQFVLHFQPIVSLEAGRLKAFEALIRWQHPTRGLLAPDEFLGVAEATGALVDIEWWVIESACRQLVLWQAGVANSLSMSINVSPQRFHHPDFEERLGSIVESCGVSSDNIQLEITEGSALRQNEATLGLLRRLRAAGFRIAIDDFGIGYSSLSNLRTLPVDVLKIDRSFIHSVGRGAEDEAFIAAIITLAHGLDIPVVAEGVELESQRDALKTLGCDFAQGYLFSRPLDPDQCSQLLEESHQPWRGLRA